MKIYKDLDWPEKYDVSAIKIDQESVAEAAVWTKGIVVKELLDPNKDVWIVGLNLESAYGMDRASEGDYVVQYSTGEFHVFRASEFERRFEEVGVGWAPAPRGLKPRR